LFILSKKFRIPHSVTVAAVILKNRTLQANHSTSSASENQTLEQHLGYEPFSK
jgi:hypothetical protein